MDYVTSELRLLLAQGSLVAYFLERIGDNWRVGFVTRGYPDAVSYLLDTRRKQIKEFKSLDAAISALEFIGFDVKKLTACN